MTDISVRDLKDHDLPFIFTTWLKAYKFSSYFAKKIKNSIYFEWHHFIIENILKKQTAIKLVAHLKDDPDILLGYLIGEKTGPQTTVHFIFVKREFRNLGIAKELFKQSGAELPCQFSHWTFSMDEIIKKHPDLTYNPYSI